MCSIERMRLPKGGTSELEVDLAIDGHQQLNSCSWRCSGRRFASCTNSSVRYSMHGENLKGVAGLG